MVWFALWFYFFPAPLPLPNTKLYYVIGYIHITAQWPLLTYSLILHHRGGSDILIEITDMTLTCYFINSKIIGKGIEAQMQRNL